MSAAVVGGAPPTLPAPPAAPCIEGYLVVRRLGQGGMGTVWQAVQLSTSREVALKCMLADRFATSESRARFEREVEVAAKLEHPNIARVYDSGLHHGVYYYAMELVRGVHLDQYISQHRLSQRQVLELMRAVCHAVQHAHQNAVIHRDLKPSNIMVGDDDEPRVLDFGLAKVLQEGQITLPLPLPGAGAGTPEEDGARRTPELSVEGRAAGTLAYMSPEQASGQHQKVDTRSDVYSLGVILYQLLTGKLPHDMSGTHAEAQHRKLEQEVQRPRSVTRQIDRDLEALLLKALDREPDRRYSNAGEMARDLGNYLNQDPLIAKPLTATYVVLKRVRKYRGRVSVAAALLVTLIALAIFSYVRIAIERNRAYAAEQQAISERQRAEEEAERHRRTAYFKTIAWADAEHQRREPGRARELLDSTDKDLRGWEWDRLNRIVDTAALTIDTSAAPVEAFALSPDGRLIAGGSMYPDLSGITVWDRSTGATLLTLPGHEKGVVRLTFSGDGGRLVSGGFEGQIKVWSIPEGQLRLTLATNGPAFEVSISPSGARLATLSHQKNGAAVRLWDARDGSVLKEYPLVPGARGVWFGPDDTTLWYVRGEGTATELLDLETGRRLLHINELRAEVLTGALNRHRSLLATGDNQGRLAIWDLQAGRVLRQSTARHDGAIRAMAWSADGRYLATTGEDRTVRLWDAQTMETLTVHRGHRRSAASVGITPDGRWLVSGERDAVRVWDATVQPDQLVLGARHTRVARFTMDAQRQWVLAFDKQAGLHVWRADDLQPLLVKRAPQERQGVLVPRPWVSDTAFSPSGQRFATVSNARQNGGNLWQVAIWNTSGFEPVKAWEGEDDVVTAVRWAGEQHLVTAAGPDPWSVTIWDTATGQRVRSLEGGHPLDVSRDGRLLVSGASQSSGGTIRVWDLHAGRLLYEIAAPAPPAPLVALCLDAGAERLAALWQNGSAGVWSVASGEALGAPVQVKAATAVAFLGPASPTLVTTGSAVQLWDAGTGQPIMTIAARLAGSFERPVFDVLRGRLFCQDHNGRLLAFEAVPVTRESSARTMAGDW